MRKPIFLILFSSLVLLFHSCEEHMPPLFSDFSLLFFDDEVQDEFDLIKNEDGQPIDASFVIKYVTSDATDANFEIEIDPSSTAEEGRHYTMGSNRSFTIAVGDDSVVIPYQILDDNFNDEEVTLTLNIINSNVTVDAGLGSSTHSISIFCNDDISGDVDYVHEATDMNGREFTYNGSMKIETLGFTGKEFKVEDMSYELLGEFGQEDLSDGLKYVVDCGAISIGGRDGSSEEWTLEEVIESGGPVLTYRWTNPYGMFGTVSLTRTDGGDWPALVAG